jgi:hypothetical protein
MSTIKYPTVYVDLYDVDSNAFAIMGAVTKAMRKEGISKEERDAYFAEATSGDYSHLLATTAEWVNVEL